MAIEDRSSRGRSCDYELPGHLPGVVKDLLGRSLVERTMRETGEKLRALAEATVPAPA